MRWKGFRSKLGHSFFSPGPKERSKVMILYYDREGYVRLGMVYCQSPTFHLGGAR
jgi:hypothetical protein